MTTKKDTLLFYKGVPELFWDAYLHLIDFRFKKWTRKRRFFFQNWQHGNNQWGHPWFFFYRFTTLWSTWLLTADQEADEMLSTYLLFKLQRNLPHLRPVIFFSLWKYRLSLLNYIQHRTKSCINSSLKKLNR